MEEAKAPFALEAIENALDVLRAALNVPDDLVWFEMAFAPCAESLTRLRSLTTGDAMTAADGRWQHRAARDRPGMDAARTITSALIDIANRMRTEVFQPSTNTAVRDEAADFIGRVYLDVLKPIFSAYPDLKPKELT